MEVSYGIGVTNRYALFYDENEDPMDVLKTTQVKEASVAPVKKTVEKDSKQDKTKPAEVKAKTATAPAQVKKGPKETQLASKSAEQIKPREGSFLNNIQIFTTSEILVLIGVIWPCTDNVLTTLIFTLP